MLLRAGQIVVEDADLFDPSYRSLGLAQASSCGTQDGLDAEFLLRRG